MTDEIPDQSLRENGRHPSLTTDEIPDQGLRENGRHPSLTTNEIPDRGLRENGRHPSLTTEEISKESVSENGLHPSPKARSPKRIGLALLGIALLATLGFFSYHAVTKPKTSSDSGGKSGRSRDRGAQVTPVSVGKVSQRTVPIQLQANGTVDAETTVSVIPQVGGQITGIYFKKGQDVKKGQLLFSLDDRTQIAAIQQAQGTLARDMAQVQQARAVLNKDMTQVRQTQATLAKDQAQAQYAQSQNSRYASLLKQGAVSQDQAQQYATNSQAASATLQADREAIANAQAALKVDQANIENAQALVHTDEAALKNAQVQLSYTKIYAPMDGRAGDILVQQGNVAQANNSTTPLVKIFKINPIEVSFSVPEKNLPDIQKYMKDNKLTVDVTFPDSNGQPIQGVLTFVNNTVDSSNGMIQLMGEFENPQGKLWPGRYVNATLTLANEPNAIVVSSQAVQTGPNGQFVFVVKPDATGQGGTVANVPVTPSKTADGIDRTIDGLTVVQKGLQPGQTVVTDGQANLIDGSKIRTKTASDSAGGNTPNTGRRRRSNSSGGNSSNSAPGGNS